MYFTDAIKEHALRDLPNEACGLLVQNRDEIVARPTKNVWETPHDKPEWNQTNHFQVPSKDVLDAINSHVLVGTYHSHVNRPAEFSDYDKAAAEELLLPSYVYSVLEDRFNVYYPEGKAAPLIGRPYIPLLHDCFALMQDYLYVMKGWEIPHLEHKLDDGFNGLKSGLSEFLCANGYRPVSTVRPFDVVLMTVKCHNHPNHIGVVMEDGTHMLHHLFQRPSKVDVYGGYWKKMNFLTLRHPSFFEDHA